MMLNLVAGLGMSSWLAVSKSGQILSISRRSSERLFFV
jgi:hypothetical protein